MKNWLIGKLGGVPKQTYMDGIDTYGAMLDMYANKFYKLEQENTDITKSRNGKGGGNGQCEPVGNNQPSER